MNYLTFNRGTWEDSYPFPEWMDNEYSNDYLDRIGFNTSTTTFGEEFISQIEIHESSDGKSFYAAVSLSDDGSISCNVYLPDFPSLMIFIKDYASAFSEKSSNATMQEMLLIFEKLFHIHHGHSADSICPQCDPEGCKTMRR
ncbi:MAG: hypothetical protein D3921_05785 [Candidatus Electrothrix sp. AW1]|nr:hypothetical protein [Candidatus Electrothrix sp. AX1]MCI5182013.1 hypothetical protein [Candidatus Electrothrix gigas]